MGPNRTLQKEEPNQLVQTNDIGIHIHGGANTFCFFLQHVMIMFHNLGSSIRINEP